jgi:hypothetical protein
VPRPWEGARRFVVRLRSKLDDGMLFSPRVDGAASMIRCVRFRAYEKNTLKGFADLELTRVGLVLHDCPWHEKNGKEWVGFPARSYQDADGNTRWAPLVEFAEGATEARQQFQELAIEAIHQAVAADSGEAA